MPEISFEYDESALRAARAHPETLNQIAQERSATENTPSDASAPPARADGDNANAANSTTGDAA